MADKNNLPVQNQAPGGQRGPIPSRSARPCSHGVNPCQFVQRSKRHFGPHTGRSSAVLSPSTKTAPRHRLNSAPAPAAQAAVRPEGSGGTNNYQYRQGSPCPCTGDGHASERTSMPSMNLAARSSPDARAWYYRRRVNDPRLAVRAQVHQLINRNGKPRPHKWIFSR